MFWNFLGYCLDSIFSILWVFCNCNSLMVWCKPDIYPHMWNTLWLIVSQPIFIDVLAKGFGQVNITFRLLFSSESRLFNKQIMPEDSTIATTQVSSIARTKNCSATLTFATMQKVPHCSLLWGKIRGWSWGVGEISSQMSQNVKDIIRKVPKKVVVDSTFWSMLLHVARLKTGAQLGNLFASEWCWRVLRTQCCRIGPFGM